MPVRRKPGTPLGATGKSQALGRSTHTFFRGEPGLPGVPALARPSLASSSRANGATARAAARGSQAGELLRAQPRGVSLPVVAPKPSTRVAAPKQLNASARPTDPGDERAHGALSNRGSAASDDRTGTSLSSCPDPPLPPLAAHGKSSEACVIRCEAEILSSPAID